MAYLAASSGGLWSSAESWQLIDATSLSDSINSNTALTTSFVGSVGFMPGAIQIDGIAVRIASRNVGSAGTDTMSVALSGETGIIGEASGSIFINDIDDVRANIQASSVGQGWFFFKFSAPYTLTAGQLYNVAARVSATTIPVNLYRSATTNDWSRYLRTTTAQAPVDNDVIIIAGALTGPGLGNYIAQTMDLTSGAVITNFGVIYMCKRGRLHYDVQAATNYYLRTSGVIHMWADSHFTMGTVSTPIPSSSTATLEFNNNAAAAFGLEIRNGARFVAQGSPRSPIHRTRLFHSAAVGNTQITVQDTPNWFMGDEIAIASMTSTFTDTEKVTVSGDTVGTLVPVTALTRAHSGFTVDSLDYRAEVINLTRNVRIRGHRTQTTFSGYMRCEAAAFIDCDYAEFINWGSGTANKRGIDIFTGPIGGSGMITMDNCSFHDFTNSAACLWFLSTDVDNIYLRNNNVFSVGERFYIGPATSGSTGIVVDSNWMLYSPGAIGASECVELTDVGIQFSGNVVVSGNKPGIVLNQFDRMGNYLIRDNISHSHVENAWDVQQVCGGAASGLVGWGVALGECFSFNGCRGHQIWDRIVAHSASNGNPGVSFETNETVGDFIMKRVSLQKGPTVVGGNQTMGIRLTTHVLNFLLDQGKIGTDGAHSVGDIAVQTSLSSTNQILIKGIFRDVILGSTIQMAFLGNLFPISSYLRFQRFGQVSGDHRSYYREGIVSRDSVIYDQYPSIRMTPSGSMTAPLRSGYFKVAVTSGQILTVSVKVRKSVSGDGAAYNGPNPRLMLEGNISAGVSLDTVLATATAASEGAFETISGTTPMSLDDTIFYFYVDILDGTTGWVNVDSFSVFVAN